MSFARPRPGSAKKVRPEPPPAARPTSALKTRPQTASSPAVKKSVLATPAPEVFPIFELDTPILTLVLAKLAASPPPPGSAAATPLASLKRASPRLFARVLVASQDPLESTLIRSLTIVPDATSDPALIAASSPVARLRSALVKARTTPAARPAARARPKSPGAGGGAAALPNAPKPVRTGRDLLRLAFLAISRPHLVLASPLVSFGVARRSDDDARLVFTARLAPREVSQLIEMLSSPSAASPPLLLDPNHLLRLPSGGVEGLRVLGGVPVRACVAPRTATLVWPKTMMHPDYLEGTRLEEVDLRVSSPPEEITSFLVQCPHLRALALTIDPSIQAEYSLPWLRDLRALDATLQSLTISQPGPSPASPSGSSYLYHPPTPAAPPAPLCLDGLEALRGLISLCLTLHDAPAFHGQAASLQSLQALADVRLSLRYPGSDAGRILMGLVAVTSLSIALGEAIRDPRLAGEGAHWLPSTVVPFVASTHIRDLEIDAQFSHLTVDEAGHLQDLLARLPSLRSLTLKGLSLFGVDLRTSAPHLRALDIELESSLPNVLDIPGPSQLTSLALALRRGAGERCALVSSLNPLMPSLSGVRCLRIDARGLQPRKGCPECNGIFDILMRPLGSALRKAELQVRAAVGDDAPLFRLARELPALRQCTVLYPNHDIKDSSGRSVQDRVTAALAKGLAEARLVHRRNKRIADEAAAAAAAARAAAKAHARTPLVPSVGPADKAQPLAVAGGSFGAWLDPKAEGGSPNGGGAAGDAGAAADQEAYVATLAGIMEEVSSRTPSKSHLDPSSPRRSLDVGLALAAESTSSAGPDGATHEANLEATPGDASVTDLSDKDAAVAASLAAVVKARAAEEEEALARIKLAVAQAIQVHIRAEEEEMAERAAAAAEASQVEASAAEALVAADGREASPAAGRQASDAERLVAQDAQEETRFAAEEETRVLAAAEQARSEQAEAEAAGVAEEARAAAAVAEEEAVRRAEEERTAALASEAEASWLEAERRAAETEAEKAAAAAAAAEAAEAEAIRIEATQEAEAAAVAAAAEAEAARFQAGQEEVTGDASEPPASTGTPGADGATAETGGDAAKPLATLDGAAAPSTAEAQTPDGQTVNPEPWLVVGFDETSSESSRHSTGRSADALGPLRGGPNGSGAGAGGAPAEQQQLGTPKTQPVIATTAELSPDQALLDLAGGALDEELKGALGIAVSGNEDTGTPLVAAGTSDATAAAAEASGPDAGGSSGAGADGIGVVVLNGGGDSLARAPEDGVRLGTTSEGVRLNSGSYAECLLAQQRGTGGSGAPGPALSADAGSPRTSEGGFSVGQSDAGIDPLTGYATMSRRRLILGDSKDGHVEEDLDEDGDRTPQGPDYVYKQSAAARAAMLAALAPKSTYDGPPRSKSPSPAPPQAPKSSYAKIALAKRNGSGPPAAEGPGSRTASGVPGTGAAAAGQPRSRGQTPGTGGSAGTGAGANKGKVGVAAAGSAGAGAARTSSVGLPYAATALNI